MTQNQVDGKIAGRHRPFQLLLEHGAEMAGVLLVLVTLGIATWSITAANWISPQPPLMLVLCVAVVMAFLLAKSRLPGYAAHSLLLITGIAAAVWQTSVFLNLPHPMSLPQRIVSSLQIWWQAFLYTRPNESALHFTMFLVLMTWLIGYLSVWVLLRRRSAWMAVFLGTVTLFFNLSNLPENFDYFFPLYSLAALLLLGQANLVKLRDWAKECKISSGGRGLVYSMSFIAVFSIVTVSAASSLPKFEVTPLSPALSTEIPLLQKVEKSGLNVFAFIPAKWKTVTSTEQETLSLHQPVDRSDKIQFIITSPRAAYWRTRSYDTYSSSGWTSVPAQETDLKTTAGLPGNHLKLAYNVESKIKTDVLLVAGEFISADIPAVGLVAPADTAGIPAGYVGTEDIIAVVSPHPIKPDQQYQVVSAVTSISAEELSGADGNYPPEIVGRYLQLPENLPRRVSQLSRDIVRDQQARTAYEKVMAIKNFVGVLHYNEAAEVVPQGRDGVDYFLFVQRQGACNNFASAMVVMLRSAGVPARLVTGFLPGELDEFSSEFIIRARDYHAWPEVYFPGYGWVEFEATPLDREAGAIAPSGDELLEEEESGSTVIAVDRGSPVWTVFRIILLAVSIPLFLLIALRLAFSLWVRSLKETDFSGTVYAKMCSLAGLLNVAPRSPETPLEYSARLATAFPEQAGALSTIGQTYVETLFSTRKALEGPEREKLRQSWQSIARAWFSRIMRFRR